MMARPPLRNVNDMVLALLLLLAGVGPGLGPGLGTGGAAGQLSPKPTRGPHPSSPCPSVFSYEGREPEKNRWNGVILLTTDETLDGLVLSLRLTHRAQVLGNDFGDVSTSDNTEYTILNLKQRLSPGPPLPVKIFAAFGDRDDTPYIATIKLNGRTICGTNNPDLLAVSRTTPGTPAITRPAGIGGAGGAGIAAGHQFEEEPRPAPPPRTTPTPAPAPRPTTAYEPAQAQPAQPPPNANPDNYGYSNTVSHGEAAGGQSYSPNQYDSTTRRPAQPSVDVDVYRQQQQPQQPKPTTNYTSAADSKAPVDDAYAGRDGAGAAAEAERGIYRPASSPPTTERPAPVYTPAKYAPNADRDDYQTPRTPPRQPTPPRKQQQPPPRQQPPPPQRQPPPTRMPPTPSASRPASAVSTADRRVPTMSTSAVVDVDVSSAPPQPWPTSNYPDPGQRRPAPDSRPDRADRPAPDRPAPDAVADSAPSRPRTTRSTCGTIAPPATPLIINGETSIPGKWPWHVALYKPHGRDWKYQCGGSLVSPTVVVTAAHCVTTTVGRPVGPESLLVFLGKHALRTTSEDGVQDKHVYFIHVHPEYNYTNYRNDIAVLILSSPATITSAVRPVCLWDRDRTDLAHVEGKFGTVVGWRTDIAQTEDSDKVVGWGIETDGLLTEELHQALMPVVSPAICVYSYPSFFGVYTNNQTYCAGYSPDQPAAGTSVCNGDSGGGMFFKQNEDVPDDEAVWMLRGLVSLSVRTKQDRCDPSHFVVFTDVAKYVDWLENFLAP